MSPNARVPHRMEVDASKRHARHKSRRGDNGNKARHKSQPSAISGTPATQSEGQCRLVPRLPHRMEVDASKCQVCHTNSRGDNETSAPPEPAQGHKCHACHAKCHTCHTERRCMFFNCHTNSRSDNGNQARHKRQPSAISATPATQNEGRCHRMPRVPHRMEVDASKRHARHKNRRGDNGNKARHKSQPSAISGTPATQSEGQCRQVLPHRMEVDASKCHVCHTNSRGDNGNKARHQSQPSAISATPARQSEFRCRQVCFQIMPRLRHSRGASPMR